MFKKIKENLGAYWNFLEHYKYSLSFIFIISIPMLFQNLGVAGFHSDGLLYAAASKHAATMGHWLVPYVNPNFYPKFFEHPPFFIMYQGVLFKIFGVSWTVARLSNVILAMIVVFKLRNFAKKIASIQIAQWAAVILLLSIPFTRKVRFPNMDIGIVLFSLLAFISYYDALIKNRYRDWIQVGGYVGLTFLMKGIPAMFVPTVCFLHLTWSGRWKLLLTPKPWLSVILGLSIFSIWPLLLWYQGEFYGFQYWFNTQFFTIVKTGRGLHSPPLTFVKILVKDIFPWIALAFFGAYKAFKFEKRDHWFFLALIWFFTVLIAFSMIKVKLSHYILPLYPPLALMAAYGIAQLTPRKSDIYLKSIYTIALLAIFLFVSFPIANKVRRNVGLYKMITYVKENQLPVKRFISLTNLVKWSTISLVSFETDWPLYHVTNKKDLQQIMKKSDVIFTNQTLNLPNIKLIYKYKKKSQYLYYVQ